MPYTDKTFYYASFIQKTVYLTTCNAGFGFGFPSFEFDPPGGLSGGLVEPGSSLNIIP